MKKLLALLILISPIIIGCFLSEGFRISIMLIASFVIGYIACGWAVEQLIKGRHGDEE